MKTVKKAGNDKCLHHPEYVGCAHRPGVASLDVAVMVNWIFIHLNVYFYILFRYIIVGVG